MGGICDVPVISTVCDVAGETAATLVAAPFDWLAQAIGNAASWMFQGVWALFDSTTLVDVTNPDYIGVYNVIFGIGVLLTLILFCLQLITGLIHRDPTALSRAALGLARAVLGSFVVITLTTLLLEVVDQLSIGIVQATGTTLEEMGAKIGILVAGLTTLNLAAPGAGALVTIFLGFLALSGAAIVWFSLLIRKALILVAVVLAPIALAGSSWETTKGWFSKWASFVLALILSKLVIVVVFLVAINQVNAPLDLDLASIADPVAGIVLMFVAAFAPYMTYKFVSFLGFDMYHVMSAEQEAKQSMNRPIPVPGAPNGPVPKQVLDGGGDSDGGGGGGDSAAPPGPAAPAGGGVEPAPSGGESTASTAGTEATAAEAGTAGAATAVAAPVAAALIAKDLGEGAADAGPAVGHSIGGAADAHASQAGQAPPASEPAPAVPPTQRTSPAPPPPSTAGPDKT